MKITDFILCEDIRQEVDNKQSLMGVFGDKIIVRLLPGSEKDTNITIRLGVFVRIDFDETDRENDLRLIELVIEHAGNTISLGKGPLTLKDKSVGNRLLLTAVMKTFPYKEDGDINVIITLFDENGEKMISISPERTVKIELSQE